MKMKDIKPGTQYTAQIAGHKNPTVVVVGFSRGLVQCQIVDKDGGVGTMLFKIMPQHLKPLGERFKKVVRRKKDRMMTNRQALQAEKIHNHDGTKPKPERSMASCLVPPNTYTVAMILYRGADDFEEMRSCLNQGICDAQDYKDPEIRTAREFVESVLAHFDGIVAANKNPYLPR